LERRKSTSTASFRRELPRRNAGGDAAEVGPATDENDVGAVRGLAPREDGASPKVELSKNVSEKERKKERKKERERERERKRERERERERKRGREGERDK
jgi:hypothetical protein